MHDALGWIATAIFTSSYFFNEPAKLRLIQAAAACLWIVYGFSIGSLPVIIANAIVALVAVYSVSRLSSQIFSKSRQRNGSTII